MTELELLLVALAENKDLIALLLRVVSGGKVTKADATKALMDLEVAASDAEMRREFGGP